jgi:hypothetical protein
MSEVSMFKDLIPAILAGLIGGLGAFIAVKTDVAVLMDNQAGFKEDLVVVKGLSERMVKQEGYAEFLQYQVDQIQKELSSRDRYAVTGK